MVDIGLASNVVTYTSLIDAHWKTGEMDTTLRIFENMQTVCDLQCAGFTLTERKINLICFLSDAMRGKILVPDVITNTTLFCCICMVRWKF